MERAECTLDRESIVSESKHKLRGDVEERRSERGGLLLACSL
jgi:hypothetical protein